MSVIFDIGKKRIGSTKYKVLIATTKSDKNNKWFIYKFYKSNKAKPTWLIKRYKDGLVLSNYGLGEVSLYRYNKNKDKIKKMINDKEKKNP